MSRNATETTFVPRQKIEANKRYLTSNREGNKIRAKPHKSGHCHMNVR